MRKRWLVERKGLWLFFVCFAETCGVFTSLALFFLETECILISILMTHYCVSDVASYGLCVSMRCVTILSVWICSSSMRKMEVNKAVSSRLYLAFTLICYDLEHPSQRPIYG
jgi:hypothetical protein